MKVFDKLVAGCFAIALSNVAFAYYGGYENSLDGAEVAGGYGNYDKTLTSVLDLPTDVAANAYAQCKYLQSVDLKGVTSIGDAAFAYSALDAVTIPASVSSIGFIAFGGCANLKTLTVESWDWVQNSNPEEREPFKGCGELKNLVVTAEAAVVIPAFEFTAVFPSVNKISCPAANFELWQTKFAGTGIEVEPVYVLVQGEPVAVSTAGIVDGQFCLTLPAASGVYGVWTNADLSVPVAEWGLMESKASKGDPLEFKLTLDTVTTQLFFRAFSVDYK